MLKAAAESGNLGAFKVNGSSIVATEDNDFKSPPTTTRPTPGNPPGKGVLSYISDRFSFPDDVFTQRLFKSLIDLKNLLYSQCNS